MAAQLLSIFENIRSGENARAELAKLRDLLKQSEGGISERESLLVRIKEYPDVLPALLRSEDAKTRKNTAMLIGDLKLVYYTKVLFAAYKRETMYFVRVAMLEVISAFPSVIPPNELQVLRDEILRSLRKDIKDSASRNPGAFDNGTAVQSSASCDKASASCNKPSAVSDGNTDAAPVDNARHICAELALLNVLIKRTGLPEHTFSGFNEASKLILITNRNQKEAVKQAVLREAPESAVSDSNAGLLVKSDNIRALLKVRPVQEFLFLCDDFSECPDSPTEAAALLADRGILKYITTRHVGVAPYTFRVEMKYPDDVKPAYIQSFIKNFSYELSVRTNFLLLNSTTGYDLEIRMVKRKNGMLGVLLKFYTLRDTRFAYRKEITASSLRPSNAALMMELAKPYFHAQSAVLDPFCGTGTLLVERTLAAPTSVLYGVDLFGEAIEKAEKNITAAALEKTNPDLKHYLIKKDFSEFTHTHQFDEIITEPPALHGKYTQADLDNIYALLFRKSRSLLVADGLLVIWSHNRKAVKRFIRDYDFTVEQIYVISEPDENDVFILRK